ncbi:CobW family GTP-binding protein [Halosolutus amylolyticus]|uniref:CobW family GTP-binding protein n=1 Tax=Halosolutus amylolyticus TaxID=2932267 RepID=A0ABD5PN50_9EURY|nr:GTP-binding protein [Halosolutus amylolyticus]
MGVPVTVLSGTLGAGKTTLLNHVLTREHDYDAAVVVNDVGEINVDANLAERRVDGDTDVVELTNGCICCGIQDEFGRALVELALAEEFDYLLVEPSGISDPAPVAQQLVQSRASTFYDLSSVTTVVDARRFYDAFSEGEVRRRGSTEDGTRPLSDLIVDGVEFCDTLVVNKTDLVTDAELDYVVETLRALQPEATVLTSTFGQVDPGAVLDTGRFDVETVSDSPGWKRALKQYADHSTDHKQNRAREHDRGPNHGHDSVDAPVADGDVDHDDRSHETHGHVHPPDEYGIDSFVYHQRRPMHPERLADTLQKFPTSVVRAKGYLHVAGRPDHALVLSRAGRQTRIEGVGRWIASLPEDRRKFYRRSRESGWDDDYGDRKTELVMIGRDMDARVIERSLEACVLADAELDTADSNFENPFPNREGEEIRL